MRFFVIAASVAAALAMPALDARGLGLGHGGGGGGGGQGQLCYSGTPQCCATDVLGVADLDCAPREFLLPACVSTWNQRRLLIHVTLLTAPSLPHNSDDFKHMCASLGQRARCCAIPIVRGFFSILVDAVLIHDPMNSLDRPSSALLLSKFGL